MRCVCLAACAAAAIGCAKGAVDTDRCGKGPACEPGFLCVAARCRQVCNSDQDCSAVDEVCRDGLCDADPNARCVSHTDCIHPGPCESFIGAVCTGGACVYLPRPEGYACDDADSCTEDDVCDDRGRCVGQPRVCADPPAGSCSGDDATYTAYPTIGVCGADGSCQYPPLIVPCPDCQASCFAACASVTCPDAHGGCQTQGVCTGVGGSGCVYVPAADGRRCDRPDSAAGAGDGVCIAGVCLACRVDADCVTPSAGQAACFAGSCAAGACSYTPLPAVGCAAAECRDGFVYAPRVCGPLGDCPLPVPAGSSCLGFACADGARCKTSCATPADCAPGRACLAGGACEPPAALGEACAADGECLSGVCVDRVCCNRVCDGVCERCDAVSGPAGTCHLAAAGTDPDDECSAAPDACVTDSCSGTTAACALRPSGSDCGPCRTCDASGVCVDDDTEHAACPACQQCSGGVCVVQPAGEDLKQECDAEPGCGTGGCNGLGACQLVAEGGDCGVCRRCDGAGACVASATDHGDCGFCEKCAGGGCVMQARTEDLKDECAPEAGCGSGFCNGGGACDLAVSGADCGTCRSCDGAGRCWPNATDHGDCPVCQKCVAGACAVQTSSEDLKDECNPDPGCGTGSCDGGGACAFTTAGTYCGLCAACDASGRCNQALADDSACGVIDCDGRDSTATCSNYQDLTSNRCEGVGNCKDANTSDCTVASPYSSSTICRDNAGADNCDRDEYCTGSATSCPADDFTWSSGQICSGGTAGTLVTLATGRSNVTATDRTNCRDHCDTIASVTCCLTEGIPAIPPYVPNPMVYCLPYTGATSLASNTTYDYWSALCR